MTSKMQLREQTNFQGNNTRWKFYLRLRELLKAKTPNNVITGDEFGDLFITKKVLGKGVYGTVYEAHVVAATAASAESKKNAFVAALKSVDDFEFNKDQRSDAEQAIKKILKEDCASAYLNALVFLKICPNFCVNYRSFMYQHTGRRNNYSFLNLMEKADGDCNRWLSRHFKQQVLRRAPAFSTQRRYLRHGVETFFHFVAQIFMAIVAYTHHLDIVHNDLYPRNILYNVICAGDDNNESESPATTFVYHFEQLKRCFVLKNVQYLFKVSDFGICSSPYCLDFDHSDYLSKIENTAHIETNFREDFDVKKNHVLEYVNIPPHCRDVLSFLGTLESMLLNENCRPVHEQQRECVRLLLNWIHQCILLLDEVRPKSPNELIFGYVMVIFSNAFLETTCGIPNELFNMELTAAATSAEDTSSYVRIDDLYASSSSSSSTDKKRKIKNYFPLSDKEANRNALSIYASIHVNGHAIPNITRCYSRDPAEISLYFAASSSSSGNEKKKKSAARSWRGETSAAASAVDFPRTFEPLSIQVFDRKTVSTIVMKK